MKRRRIQYLIRKRRKKGDGDTKRKRKGEKESGRQHFEGLDFQVLLNKMQVIKLRNNLWSSLVLNEES